MFLPLVNDRTSPSPNRVKGEVFLRLFSEMSLHQLESKFLNSNNLDSRRSHPNQFRKRLQSTRVTLEWSLNSQLLEIRSLFRVLVVRILCHHLKSLKRKIRISGMFPRRAETGDVNHRSTSTPRCPNSRTGRPRHSHSTLLQWGSPGTLRNQQKIMCLTIWNEQRIPS